MDKLNKKSHRDRKNPHAAEVEKARRHAANALRPKQKTDLILVNEGTDEEDIKVVGPYRD